MKEGAKELGKHLVKKGAQNLCKNIFSEKLIRDVIKKVKDFIENNCMRFFDDIIKSFLIKCNEFKWMLVIDNIIGDDDWSKTLYK